MQTDLVSRHDTIFDTMLHLRTHELATHAYYIIPHTHVSTTTLIT